MPDPPGEASERGRAVHPDPRQRQTRQQLAADDSSTHTPAIFTADSIKDILRNPRYAGRVPVRDDDDNVRIVEGTYPAIIDAATFEKRESIRLSKRFKVKRKAGAGKGGSPYLLSGLLRCPTCGSTMSGSTRGADRSHSVRRSYVCYMKRVAGGCKTADVLQDFVEAELLVTLRTMGWPASFARAVDKAVAARMRTFSKVTTVSAAALAERQRRVNEMYKLGRMEKDEYDAECREIDKQRLRVAAPPAPLFAQQQQVLTTFVEEWDETTTDEKKRMLAAIFDSITVNDDKVRFEACEVWRPYLAAAIPRPVRLPEPGEGADGAEDGTRTRGSPPHHLSPGMA